MPSNRPSARPCNADQSGFVLVMVLVALVVLSMLAAAVAVVSERAVREATRDRDAFDAEVAAIGTRDTLLYLMTTQRRTFGGITVDDQVSLSAGQATAFANGGADEFGSPLSTLPIGNEIRLDATPYLGLGDVHFSLQDDAGLFSLNWTPPAFRSTLFAALGVPPERWDALEASRLDYQDPDDLYRIGGAETQQYRERHRPGPTNRTLATPLEARRILGWDKALAGLDDARLMALLTTSRSVQLNVNTATTASLRMLPGVDASLAARIVALRERMPYVLPWQFIRDFDLPLDELQPFGLLAVGYGTMTLWHNAGPKHVLHWTLTPVDTGGRPWRLDYEITLPRDQVTDSSPARPTAAPLLAGPATVGR